MAGQGKNTEAKPLLLSGGKGPKQRERFIPFDKRYVLSDKQ